MEARISWRLQVTLTSLCIWPTGLKRAAFIIVINISVQLLTFPPELMSSSSGYLWWHAVAYAAHLTYWN